MSGQDNGNPYGGQNKASSILVTLVIFSFVVVSICLTYRRFHALLARQSPANYLGDASTHMVDSDNRPILWDVCVETERFEWDWHRFKPLSAAVTNPLPPSPWARNRFHKLPDGKEGVVHISAIITFPSQRKERPGCLQEAPADDYVIGVTAARCIGLASS